MKKKIYFTLLLIFAIATAASAQDELSKVGTSMAQFLKWGVSARGSALGDAYAAATNDATALVWNPAGIQQNSKRSFALSHTQLFAGIQLNFLAATFPINHSSTLGVSVVNLNSGDIEVTNESQPEGTGENYQDTDLLVGLSYSKRLTDKFALGITVKYVEERLYHEKASTFAFDAGTQFDTGIYGMRLGIAMQNIGGEMKLDGEDLNVPYYNTQTGFYENSGSRLRTQKWPIPVVYRMGASIELMGPTSRLISDSKNQVSFMAEANDPADHYLRYNLGMEYEWNGLFALRGGYRINYDEATYTLGGGLNFNLGGTLMQMDYAYLDFGLLDAVHQYSFVFNF